MNKNTTIEEVLSKINATKITKGHPKYEAIAKSIELRRYLEDTKYQLKNALEDIIIKREVWLKKGINNLTDEELKRSK